MAISLDAQGGVVAVDSTALSLDGNGSGFTATAGVHGHHALPPQPAMEVNGSGVVFSETVAGTAPLHEGHSDGRHPVGLASAASPRHHLTRPPQQQQRQRHARHSASVPEDDVLMTQLAEAQNVNNLRKVVQVARGSYGAWHYRCGALSRVDRAEIGSVLYIYTVTEEV